MEVPAVTDRTPSGLDTDRRRLSLREDGFDCVDDIAPNEERALGKIEEDATSLRAVNPELAEKTLEKLIIEDMEIQEDAITLGEDGSDFADDIARKEDKALEKVEEDATSLKEAESDFANETILKVEADETSRKKENGDTGPKEEENTPEKLVIGKDMEIKDDGVSLREDGSDYADNNAQKEEKVPEKIEDDVTSLRAVESDFANGNSHEEETDDSDKQETGKTIQKEEKNPEKPIIEDLRIQDDATSLRAEGSGCADDTTNGKETAPENIQEYATSLGGEGSEEETDENTKTEKKILEKPTVEKDEKIQDDATSWREDDSGCADDLVKEDKKASQDIQEGSTSFRAESSDFADETAQKEENISESIVEKDKTIKDGAVSLIADDSDRVDDTAHSEDSSSMKSTVEKDGNIQDDTTRLRGEGSACVDDTANDEEKATQDIEERSIRFPTESSDFADETAHKEENNSDGSDCADDIAQAEEKSPVKSTAEQIQEDATRLTVQSTDFPDETAHKEETDKNALKEDKNPEKLISEKDQKIEDVTVGLRGIDDTAREQDKTPTTELVQEDATSLRVPNSEFADEIAREVSNNNAVVEEPGKKEENTHKESPQARTEPDNQPAPRLASATTNPASSAAAPSTVHPAGLGRAARLLEPTPRAVQQPRVNGTASQTQTQQIEDTNGEAEEYDETREQLQMIRVKFLRLAHRLGQTPHNVVVAQVLYRLGLAEQLRGRNGGRVGAFSFDRASAMAVQLEAAGQEPLDFSCTIMVLGKTGVGKSATINSIFDEQKFCTSAFQMGTQKVQDVVGTVQGIKVRVIDTPGLLSSWSDQRHNVKILRSVKQFIKKTPPDIVLYLDRLDMQSRDFGDMPLLRTITDTFGPSIWFNAIVVLTHAASAPPDGPNGTASSYDVFVTQRSHVVQQSIRQAAGDMRLMNPVSLVENHSACRTNRAGQRVLPNGQVWKPHLLLLSFASKILAEANTLLKLQDSPPGKPSTTRSRAPPLPFLLSSLLQSRPQLKLPAEQALGDEDDDLDGSSDSDNEAEYDDLPPFTRLTKAQVAMLTKSQKKAYFDELAYREKLVMKKQLKEEKRRRKILKEMAASGHGLPNENSENPEEETDTAIPAAPMPDLALPASFDSSNPTHRYRCLDSASQWIVRPVLDTHGWDRDVGYEGINVERFFVVKNKLPVAFSGQASKDKKDANVQMEINSSLSHGEGKSTSMGFDLQTVGKDMAYTLRGETKFCNHRRNKATAGLSATILGDAFSTGLKLEDKLIINKCFRMVMAGGAMTGRGDVAYGGSLEAQWRDKDYPIGRFLSTLGLSIMDWHGDLAIGGNIQTQVPIGHSTNLIARANLNNRGAGQISVRLNSSEQLQIALVGLIPLLRKVADEFLQLQYEQQ